MALECADTPQKKEKKKPFAARVVHRMQNIQCKKKNIINLRIRTNKRASVSRELLKHFLQSFFFFVQQRPKSLRADKRLFDVAKERKTRYLTRIIIDDECNVK